MAHLAQRHGMRMRALQVAERGALHAEQAVLDAMEMLADDEQAGLRQQVVDVRHPPGQAVLARQHGKVRAPLAHRVHRGLERFARQRGHVRVGNPAGEVGVGAGHALECDRTPVMRLAF